MKILHKILLTLLLCSLALSLSACADSLTNSTADATEPPKVSIMTKKPEETPETTPTTLLEPQQTEPAIPQYDEVEAAVFSLEQADFEELCEFEDGQLLGGAAVTDVREGWSGAGYVTGVYPTGSAIIEVSLPASQHYNITLRAASDTVETGGLTVNGAGIATFELSGNGEFETLMYENVYIPEGDSIIAVTNLSGSIDLDCMLIQSSSDVFELSYDLSESKLCYSESDENSEKLYSYLINCYGKRVLTGQQCSQGTNAELELVHEMTGRYPAIRFGELMDYSAGIDTGDAELAIEWAESGGIVGYVWNWPMNGSVYSNRTAFDITAAVTDLDIATMEGSALVLRYESGDIAAETLAVIDGIDLVAEQLKKLRDAGVPVLFRPLPEASSGQFWWSADKEAYLWLYKLIFDRMTLYHGLCNLIWVWNGQDAEWYPGDEMTDIVSLDVYYPKGSVLAAKSGLNYFLAAHDVAPTKPVALSECSNLPTPDNISLDRAYWLYAGVWTGDYAPGGDYMPELSWIQFYNNELTLALDEIDYNQ